ncbi:UNVERIFIED_CONTAM: hypothetical protein GTU68_050242 [Idotea baltica]|nr:hypothetical protein [Idotea baltica]
MQGGSTPHSFSFRPSQASALETADVIFWIGPELETFLQTPLQNLAGDAKVITLENLDGLERQARREGDEFEAHDHDEDHDDHAKHEDEHAEKDHDHEHKEAHDGHHGHEHDSELDTHIWLDPENAAVMVSAIADTLSKIDPANASHYAANAKSTQDRLAGLTKDISASLAPVKDKPFVVFHDAYQAFETRFGIAAIGSLTINPQIKPGAERIDQIQKKIRSLSAVCVFSEPQFKSSLVDVIIEGTDASQGVLDPLGATLDDGPELYFSLLKNMANSFHDCLKS